MATQVELMQQLRDRLAEEMEQHVWRVPEPAELVTIDVTTSRYLRDGMVVSLAGGRLVIGTRPLTDLEFARAEATHLVRTGFADVLAWLGEDVGPPPARSGRGEQILEALLEQARR